MFLLNSLIPVLSQAEEHWVPFILGYPEGTPSVITASEDGNNTIIELTVPGMWVEDKGERHIGIIQNWGKLEMLKTLYDTKNYEYALKTHCSFVLLGDPSLEVVPPMSPRKDYITM
ncbi:MAG: hypothetical protein ACUVWP_00315 [bacterium]